MKNLIILTGLAFLLLTGCQKDNSFFDNMKFQEEATLATEPVTTVRNTAVIGEPFTLQYEQSVLVLPDGIYVTFMDVPEDSRCPAGTTCFREGRAQVKLSLEDRDEYTEVILATPNSQKEPPVASPVYHKTISLLDVAPYPSARHPQIPLSSYRVTLMLENGTHEGIGTDF